MRKTRMKTVGIRQGLGIPHPLCRHVEDGSVPIAKLCIRNHECWHCAFDQWLEVLAEMPKVKEEPGICKDVLAKAA